MTKLLYRLLAIILPAGLLVVAFNYFVDPANLFSSVEYVSGIAAILSKGHNADNISNYDERLLQEQMVKRLEKAPDIVMLGSSRIMEAGSDFFPGKQVLNCGVSHATIRDLIAVTSVLDSFQRLPAQIFINADIGLISEKSTAEWQSLNVFFNRFIERYSGEIIKGNDDASLRFKKMYSLVSFEYFRESLLFLLKGAEKKYTDAGLARPVNYGRFADGSVSYSNQYMHPDTLKIASDAFITAKQQGLSLPDSTNMRLLNALLDFFEARHVKVTLVLLPYHPAYYAGANVRGDNLFNWYESYYKQLAAKRHLALSGGFDARVHGIAASEFYDMYHCSGEAVKRIFFNK